MLDDRRTMAEQWIIRVQGKEYGPADLATLHEWKSEGRVLPGNEARPVDVDLWSSAAKIPGLFETAPPPVQFQAAEPVEHHPPAKIFARTFRIYGQGFFQFLGLALLVIAPSVCAQLTGPLIETAPHVDVDLRALVAAGFAFCMLLLFLVLWPIYIAGIQILTAELAAGRQIGFLTVLNEALKFWPRVAFLCLFVAVCYLFWSVLPIGLILMIALGGPSVPSFFLALLVLAFQVWMTGRLFVNFMFWQQFAVLEGCDAAESLRRSKELARSGAERVWFRRPMWRGVFIASLWFALVLAINWPSIWPYFHMFATATDSQALMEMLRTSAKSSAVNGPNLIVGLVQSLLRPLLGIAFVLLYLDESKSGRRGDTDSSRGEIDIEQ
jgi:hypothetical protein